MKRFLIILFSVLFIAGMVAANPFGGGTIGPVPPDDTAYDSTTWDGDLRAATKNVLRDQFVAADSTYAPIGVTYITQTAHGSLSAEQAMGALGTGAVWNTTTTGVQSIATELTAIEGLTSAADKGIQFTGAGTAGLFDLTAFGKSILDDADEATFKATVNLEAGTDFNTYSATLNSLAGLTETNGGIPYGTADDAYSWLAAGAQGTLLMGNGAGAPSFLAAGTAGYFLLGNGAADPVWTTQPTLTSLEGLTFTNGDIIYASGADTLVVLDHGTAGYLLQANGVAAPTWVVAPSGGSILRSQVFN